LACLNGAARFQNSAGQVSTGFRTLLGCVMLAQRGDLVERFGGKD
jgi:hypothetical protein